MKKHDKYNRFKEVCKFISTVLSWTFFVLLLIIAGLLLYYFISTKIYASKGDNYKPAFGLYTIVSPSMEPNLKIYDVIVDTNVNSPDDIKEGDIITFISTSSLSKGMTITHRVIKIEDTPDKGRVYYTKGDNNLSPDARPAEYQNILGKVILKIPQLGRVQSFLATKGGWLVVVVIPALIIIIKDVLKLFKLKNINDSVNEINKKEEEQKIEEEKKKQEIKENLKAKYKLNRSNEGVPFERKVKIVSVSMDSKMELPLKIKEEKSENSKPKKTRTRKNKKNSNTK